MLEKTQEQNQPALKKLTGRTQGILLAGSKEENEYSEEWIAKLCARS